MLNLVDCFSTQLDSCCRQLSAFVGAACNHEFDVFHRPIRAAIYRAAIVGVAVEEGYRRVARGVWRLGEHQTEGGGLTYSFCDWDFRWDGRVGGKCSGAMCLVFRGGHGLIIEC